MQFATSRDECHDTVIHFIVETQGVEHGKVTARLVTHQGTSGGKLNLVIDGGCAADGPQLARNDDLDVSVPGDWWGKLAGGKRRLVEAAVDG